MTIDVDKIKKLATEDLIVGAVELPAGDHSEVVLSNNVEQALARFEEDDTQAAHDYSHYVIRVKKEKQATPIVLEEAPTTSVEEISMRSLVEETLQMIPEPTETAVAIETAELVMPTQPPAEAAPEAALQAEPQATPEASEQAQYTPDFLFENAKILEENKEYELARNIYLSLVKQGLHISKCMANIARTLEKQNRLAEAIHAYQDAIAYSSESELYKNLAALQIRMGNDTEACETLIRALGLPKISDDEIFEFQKSLGNCYTRLGNYLKAEHHYWKAFELNATSDTLQVNVGSLALQKNDLSAAQKHFEKALDLNSKNDKAISGLGMVYLAQGNIRRAHDQFVRSLELNLNSNLGAVYNLVKCAYELKKFDDAAKILRLYTESHPINTNILYSYSGILYHLGEHQRAQAEVEKILLHSPDHAGALELKELISKKAPTNQ